MFTTGHFTAADHGSEVSGQIRLRHDRMNKEINKITDKSLGYCQNSRLVKHFESRSLTFSKRVFFNRIVGQVAVRVAHQQRERERKREREGERKREREREWERERVRESVAHSYAWTLVCIYYVLAFVKLRITFSISVYIMCVMFVQRFEPHHKFPCLLLLLMLFYVHWQRP